MTDDRLAPTESPTHPAPALEMSPQRSRARRRRRLLLLSALAAGLLLGCAAKEPTGSSSEGPSASEQAEPGAGLPAASPAAGAQDPCDGLPDNAAFVVATSPLAGAAVSAPFEVAGCSRTFESNVVWRLLRRDDSVAAEGFTRGGGFEGPGAFRFVVDSVEGPPGLYHLEVSEPVVTEEEGFPPGRTVLPLFLGTGVEAATGGLPLGGSSAIEGAEWRLVSLAADRQVPEGVDITATFAEDRVSGNSGCNRYTATYSLADDGSLSIGPVAGTRMACPPPGGDLESVYLQALDDAASLRVEGDRLVLDGPSADLGPLTFERAP